MKKTIALFLTLIMLFGSLVACNPSEQTPDQTTETTTENTTETTTENTTESTTETTTVTTEEPGPTTPEVKIPMSDLAKYVIIKSVKATDATVNLADRLKAKINELEGGERCSVRTDTILPGSLLFREQECEILIGDTSRAQTLAYKKTLRGDDYGYTLIDKKIVIFGFNDETLEKAFDLFIDKVMSETALSDGILFTESDAVTIESRYSVSRVMIGGVSIKNCVIVYSKDDNTSKSCAYGMQTFLLNAVDFWVPVQSDATERQDGVHEILIGKTNRQEEAPGDLDNHMTYIASGDEATLVDGSDKMGFLHACALFKKMFVSDEKILKIDIKDPICENADAHTMGVMSFNVLTSGNTPERIADVFTMIRRYSPSLIGLQEADLIWQNSFMASFPEYGCLGMLGETATDGILYKKSEFTLLETNTKWLSDTPDVPESKFEESDYIRLVTWALLERKSDGKVFLFANTHLDWGAQREQIDVLMSLLEKYDCDIILTGDFNMKTSTVNYPYILSHGYTDSLDDAEIFYTTTKYEDRDARKERVIDYCFIKADAYYVYSNRVCDEGVNGTDPSDHDAVYVEMLLQ